MSSAETTRSIVEYKLGGQEIEQILAAAAQLPDSCSPLDPRFYDDRWDAYRLLPSGLLAFLETFRRTEPGAVCLIHGLPVDDGQVGATPTHWRQAVGSGATRVPELFIAMCGQALGEPFSWSTLQSGAMIQNILPVPGDEYRQSGHGSEAMLEFHTEDGFHPARCDYLLLFGVRNDEQVPTYVASVRDLHLTEAHARILAEPRFYILPDDEHIRQLEQGHPDHPALAQVREMQQRPAPVPVLFGGPTARYLRIDRPFMRCAGDDPEAERALDDLVAALAQVQRAITVEKGSLLVVDNYLAVHGRKAFRSRYDGTDRWLKRMLVSRDLRKTASACMSQARRVLI